MSFINSVDFIISESIENMNQLGDSRMRFVAEFVRKLWSVLW